VAVVLENILHVGVPSVTLSSRGEGRNCTSERPAGVLAGEVNTIQSRKCKLYYKLMTPIRMLFLQFMMEKKLLM